MMRIHIFELVKKKVFHFGQERAIIEYPINHVLSGFAVLNYFITE